jgi:hypothetical protein
MAASGFIDAGHLNTTATYDVLGWTACLFFVVRTLRGGDARGWVLAGLAAGIALENKNLILFLGAGLAAGVLIERRWDLLRSRWLWTGLGLAILIWLPNLIWQAANGFPQLEMARAIAARSGDDNRSGLALIQILFAGPLLFPIYLTGLWWLLRSRVTVAWRPVGWAYLVVIALLLVTAGKGYYAGGLIPTLIAAGAVVTAGWLDGRWAWLRRGSYVTATVASAAIVIGLVLPVVPAASFPESSVASISSDLVNQYGWDKLVAQVRAVSDTLTPEEHAKAAIVTSNYGEAGALELLSGPGLPPVYSGENSYAYWGPPDDGRTITILIMKWDRAGDYWGQWLGPCARSATIDLGFPAGTGEEQGAGVWICRGRTTPWSDIWPKITNIG